MPYTSRHDIWRRLLRGIPIPIFSRAPSSQPTPSTLTPWAFSCPLPRGQGPACRMSWCGMRDMSTEGGEGGPAAISTHPQLTNWPYSCQPRAPEAVVGERAAVANGAVAPPLPPPLRQRHSSGHDSCLDSACARCGYLRAPLAVSRPCAFAPAGRVWPRRGQRGNKKKEVKKIDGAYRTLPSS